MPEAGGRHPKAGAPPDPTHSQATDSGSGSPTAAQGGKAPPPVPTAELPPELAALGKFEVVRKLGEGGMGAVFQARHTFLDRPVAIKVMNGAALGHPEARDRFLAEMRAGGKLSHPNIAQTIDAARAGDVLFLVMEYIDGVSLDRLVKKKGPLPAALACRCAREAALGLQHAHEKGMAHRDIKPANLMVTKDKQVKVLDFGLARLPAEQGRERKTQFQTFMGTADYVSPEQAKDARSADIRSDVYSLGCTLYFLLSGRPPFRGASLVDVATQHITEAPAPLPNVPPELWAVVARMMAKRREDRYQTPAEVAEALAPFAVKRDVEESGETRVVPPPLPKPARSGLGWLVAGACVAVLVAAGVTVGLVVYLNRDVPKAVVETAPPASVPGEQAPVLGRSEEKKPVVKAEAPPAVKPAAGEAEPPPAAPPAAKVEPEKPVEKKDDAKPAEPPPDVEKVAEALAAAQADYEAARAKVKADLIDAIKAEARQYEKERKYKQQEQTEDDLKKFERVGTLPTMPGLKPAVTKHNDALRKARAAMASAYDTAIKDFRAAGRFDKVREAELDQGKFQSEAKAPPPARGKGRIKR